MKNPRLFSQFGLFFLTLVLALTAHAKDYNWVSYGRGDDWKTVKVIQHLLRAHGSKIAADGKFGAATEKAVKQFQQKRRLAVDGLVDRQTWESLVVKVQNGSRGEAAKAGQLLLRNWGAKIPADGKFGALSVAATKKFQASVKIKADGIVGPQTWSYLVQSTSGLS